MVAVGNDDSVRVRVRTGAFQIDLVVAGVDRHPGRLRVIAGDQRPARHQLRVDAVGHAVHLPVHRIRLLATGEVHRADEVDLVGPRVGGHAEDEHAVVPGRDFAFVLGVCGILSYLFLAQ